ncbi:hypothetical protein FO458_10430 [Staphylococcus lugdunensis]|nr:hypothetical protein [Staphylococcus lugdunensis]QEX30106.1 hypothetical protein FO458_10430 [Staphylococcus lugdunensis]
MISDYELFTRFNAHYIQSRISIIETDIEEMYERNTPSLCSDDVTGLIYYESYSVENLAIAIIEEREKLNKYIAKSNRDLKAFYTVLDQYNDPDKKNIKKYIKERSTAHLNLIDSFKRDLYKYIDSNRNKRNKVINQESYYTDSQRFKSNSYPHKHTLNQERVIKDKLIDENEKNISIEVFIEKLKRLDNKSFKEFIYKRNVNNITFEQVLTLLNVIPKKLPKREVTKPYNYIRDVGLKTN